MKAFTLLTAIGLTTLLFSDLGSTCAKSCNGITGPKCLPVCRFFGTGICTVSLFCPPDKPKVCRCP